MRPLWLIALSTCLTTSAWADRLILLDGSVIQGVIQEEADGAILIETGFAGVLKVDAALIDQIERDAETSDQVAEAPPPPPEEPAEPPAPAVVWTAKIRGGLSGAQGNTERFALQLRGDAKRETDVSRLSAFVESNFAREDGAESQNEIFAGLGYERDITPRWFGFGDINLERDELENLDLRLITTLGGGYFVIRKPDEHTWSLKLGAGYRQEFFQDGTTDQEALISIGSEYFIDVTGWLRFTHSFAYQPTLASPINDFRLISNAQFDLPIAFSENLTAGLNIRNQYDNDPLAGNSRLDTVYALTLTYEF